MKRKNITFYELQKRLDEEENWSFGVIKEFGSIRLSSPADKPNLKIKNKDLNKITPGIYSVKVEGIYFPCIAFIWKELNKEIRGYVVAEGDVYGIEECLLRYKERRYEE